VSFTQNDLRSIERLPDGSTDVVVSFETLEQLADPQAFVREAARVLTPGGRFIGSVPNDQLRWFGAHALLELFDGPLRIERLFAQSGGVARRASWRHTRSSTSIHWRRRRTRTGDRGRE